MDIKKRLKDDAARIAGIQPPANLRSRLQASLEGMPVGPAGRRWFKPAMAMLTAAMLAVVFLPGRSAAPELKLSGSADASPETALTEYDYRGDYIAETAKNNSDSIANEQASAGEIIAPAPLDNLPWGRVGAFSSLAALTGGLWIYEFKRRRQLALALIIPVLVLILGNLWLLRKILF